MLWIPNHDPLSQTLNNSNFHLSTFPAKINDKIFENEEKNKFWGHYCPKRIFPGNSSNVQLQGLPALKCQKHRVDWSSNQKLLHHDHHTKTVQSTFSIDHIICEIQIICEIICDLYSLTHFSLCTVTINLPKFVSACKKSAHFINSYSPKTKKAKPIFDPHHPKIIKINFGFSEFLSSH